MTFEGIGYFINAKFFRAFSKKSFRADMAAAK
jgi:hypothetical protein